MSHCSGRRHRSRSSGSTAYWGLVAVVAVAATALLIGFYSRSAPSAEGTIPVKIAMSGFNPGELRVQAGETVRVELINLDNSLHTDGGGWHNFAIDEIGLDERVAPEKRRVITFTAPTEPGEYGFYCDTCCGGRENPFMWGRLIVS